MCDQDFDDFDFGRVEEEKGACQEVQTINGESASNRSQYFREYHRRPEVIEKERLRQILSKQTKTMLTATFDEVSYAASFIL
jgi:hypothetical protein